MAEYRIHSACQDPTQYVVRVWVEMPDGWSGAVFELTFPDGAPTGRELQSAVDALFTRLTTPPAASEEGP